MMECQWEAVKLVGVLFAGACVLAMVLGQFDKARRQ